MSQNGATLGCYGGKGKYKLRKIISSYFNHIWPILEKDHILAPSTKLFQANKH